MRNEWPKRHDTPGLPFDAYEIVEVRFLHANEDTPVPLPEPFNKAEDISLIGYIVLSSSAPAVIHDSREVPGGLAWTRDVAYLRSMLAPATVRLLLVLQRPGTNT